MHSNYISLLSSIDGFGIKRLFCIYVGINQNLSKVNKLISYIGILWSSLLIISHSTSSALLSYIIPLIGISVGERVRDKGMDVLVSFDDLSLHAKSYRELKLLIGSIPSRNAYSADIFNVHASILERSGKIKLNYGSGSITGLPIIETINNDITEYIATNVISITDGQLYTNKKLFLDSCRPSIDSALSVSRIGSNAQCKVIKLISTGIKNQLTLLRLSNLGNETINYTKLISFNLIYYQDYSYISSLIETLLLLCMIKLELYMISIKDIYLM